MDRPGWTDVNLNLSLWGFTGLRRGELRAPPAGPGVAVALWSLLLWLPALLS